MARLSGLLAALGLLATLQAGAVEPYVAVYQVLRGGGSVGEATFRLSRTGDDSYRYEGHTEASGLLGMFLRGGITESSEWRVSNGRMQPVAYRYARPSRKEKSWDIRFDWATRLAVTTRHDGTAEYPLESGALDRFSVQVALAADLAAGRDQLRYRIVDRGGLRDYRFAVQDTTPVTTPAGTFDTWHVVRWKDQPDGPVAVHLWLARTPPHLPVRVMHGEDEEDFSLLLKRHQPVAVEAAARR